MTTSPGGEIQVYEAADGGVRVEVRLERETVWLNQEQMSRLFGRERSVITRHLGNVFREGELESKSNVQNIHIAGSDKPVKFYNLDVIISVGYRVKSPAGTQAKVIDFGEPARNDWLAVNQFTVAEGVHKRRPDVVLFVNGLPLVVIELKNPTDESATVWSAFQQLQTYQSQIPNLFASNAVLVASDGVQARIGALGAGKEWFKPWRTITGAEDAPDHGQPDHRGAHRP